MKKIIIYGASGHAKVIISILRYNGYELVALIDQNKEIKELYSFPVYNSIEQLLMNYELSNELYFSIAIGGVRALERLDIHNELVALNLKPATLIHPTAYIDPTAKIGEGSQILAMAVISVEVNIGRQCIINTAAKIDHESIIGNGCHIMPSATLTGCIIVEDACTIGANSTILPRLTIGHSAIVGAGAVVTKNVPPGMVVVGNPAKELRKVYNQRH